MYIILKRFIGDKRAESSATYLSAIILIFIVAMICAIYSKYSIILSNAIRVKEAMKEGCISVLTSNWDDVYNSLIEGYAGGYNYEGEEILDAEKVYDIMQKELGTIKEDEAYVYYADNDEIYKYYDIEININNTKFKNKDESLNVDLELVYEARIKIGGINFPMILKLKNRATWRARY